jgi:hypothetical protein
VSFSSRWHEQIAIRSWQMGFSITSKNRSASLNAVRVFAAAIRKTNVPNLITGEVENLQSDISVEVEKQIAGLMIKKGIPHQLVPKNFT